MWTAIIFAAVVSGVVSTQHDVGPKECTKGPQYWCTDLRTAKSCGAVKHCIENVWEKMTLPKDDSEICDECKKMVAEARQQLLSNETQDEIRQVLEGTCRIYFPVKFLADECIKYVDQFIPELIEMLASRMDPQTVCATCGLCNAAKVQVKLFAKAMIPQLNLPQIDCADCKRFVAQAENYLETATKEQVENRLIAVCKVLPSEFVNDCVDVVTKSFDQIYTFINNNLDPNSVCSLFGLCDETNNHEPQMRSVIEFFLEQKSSPECDFCQQIVQHIKDIITTNTTEEEFKDILLGFCKRLGSYDQQCEQFVNENFNLIYDFIVSELDPLKVCQALGLCDQSLVNTKQNIPLMKLTPAKQLESNDISAAPKFVSLKVPVSKPVQSPAYHPLPEKVDGQITCALCEYGLHEIQNLLMGNKSEEHIKHVIEKLCKVLPSTLVDECTSFIELYGDAILVLIAQEIDPSVVCVNLGLCKGVKAPLNVKSKFPMTKLVPAKSIDAADTQLPPERLFPNVLTVPKPIKNDNLCTICQAIVNVLDILLQNNATKQEIVSTLESVCSVLPQQYRQNCKDFVDDYVEELIDILEQVSPDQACQAIHVCSSGTKPILKKSAASCTACQVIVTDLAKLLEDETIDKAITNVLEIVCKVVPKTYRDQCDSYIETYGAYILQLLGELADSKTVCQEIDLCERPNGFVRLLGGKKCTFGPAYWCASEANAKACKAEVHCKTHVWKN